MNVGIDIKEMEILTVYRKASEIVDLRYYDRILTTGVVYNFVRVCLSV